MSDVVERLRQIAEHDWRLSHLAHTSDTAQEAAKEIERLRTLLDKKDEEIEELSLNQAWDPDPVNGGNAW